MNFFFQWLIQEFKLFLKKRKNVFFIRKKWIPLTLALISNDYMTCFEWQKINLNYRQLDKSLVESKCLTKLTLNQLLKWIERMDFEVFEVY